MRFQRRGLALVEWFAIVGLLAVAAWWYLGTLGTGTNQSLEASATNFGDPATLVNRFKKGNNGVGNGIDDAPPGNPPENDGEGTGPGSPGNQGGSL